jgi:hypothetical protein
MELNMLVQQDVIFQADALQPRSISTSLRCDATTERTQHSKGEKKKKRFRTHALARNRVAPMPSYHLFGNVGTQGTTGTKAKLGIWTIQYIVK